MTDAPTQTDSKTPRSRKPRAKAEAGKAKPAARSRAGARADTTSGPAAPKKARSTKAARTKAPAPAPDAPARPARSRARKADAPVAELKPAPADVRLQATEDDLQQAMRETTPVIDLRGSGPASAPVPAVKPEVARLAATIDMSNTTSIINFGSSAQNELQKVSQEMLAGVKNKDLGPASGAIAMMVNTIRGFSVTQADMSEKRSVGDWLMRRAAPIARFRARFEEVQGQIESIATDLEMHRGQLDLDVSALDRLYETTLDFYENLAAYVAAGEAKLAEVDAEDIPEKEAEMEAASDTDKPVVAQELRDMRAARDDLERRVHDLKLTRHVTMQSLPSIRLVQENDKALISKISSTLVNTVPLWESQMAQAITIQRSADAAGKLKMATDLTNDLLAGNARNLRQANVAIRTEMERGVFDIKALQVANSELIGTLEDSLKIADAGRERRLQAEAELKRMENELRQSLVAARAHGEARALPRS